MPKSCSNCSRLHPDDAVFCYFDGRMLDASIVDSGPINISRQMFSRPFAFPSGRRCYHFDELARACQEEWDSAIEGMHRGVLGTFLNDLGRPDLVQAVLEATHCPDRDRGLDQFLAKLPNQSLRPPKLAAAPKEVVLEALAVGQDQQIDLRLTNQGDRLLHGWVSTDSSWLRLGEPPGVQAKVFQFTREQVIPIQVRGKWLRAGAKPLEARLVIDANDGTHTVAVRVSVPVKPFPEGALAGAVSPRQLAQKAKANPKEAAILFENGAVSRWYESNGWLSPVRVPPASGVAAIQQYFEFLGLVSIPAVELSEQAVALTGRVGATVEHVLTVQTAERKPVWTYASSDQPWLEPGRATCAGRKALLPLKVTTVPGPPGNTLTAQLTVVANGNKKFTVPVTLTITETSAPRWFAQPAAVPAKPQAAPLPLTSAPAPIPVEAPEKERKRPIPWVPLLPVALLLAAFVAVILHDLFLKSSMSWGEPLLDTQPLISCQFHDLDVRVTLGEGGVKPPPGEVPQRSIPAIWEPSMRFGLLMLNEKDPKNAGRRKRLTFEEHGLTNNACVRLDGKEWLFGERPFRRLTGGYFGDWPGRWKEREVELGKDSTGRRRDGRKSVWSYDQEKVVITQIVEIVPGPQSRLLDTCLVRYQIDNHDSRAHNVGLRFLLDTYIGANDGVPFTIPGKDQLCDTLLDFGRPEEVPDFIQALENQDLDNPGTVAHIHLRLGGKLAAPDRVTLCAWPNPQLRTSDPRCLQEKTLWEVPLLPIKSLPPGDSAVVLYWNEKRVNPGESREIGFAYGLGQVASSEGKGRLGVTVGGSFVVNGQFTVTAYVSNPIARETVTIELPPGFQLAKGHPTQAVPLPLAGGRNSPVTWLVRAGTKEGVYPVRVKSSAGLAQTQTVKISSISLFK